MAILISSIIIVAVVLYSYFYHFNNWSNFMDFTIYSKWGFLSNDKADWGTFGDFFGGVVNPILTFITIIMLLNSLRLQRQANTSIIEGEERRRFEEGFYSLIEAKVNEFNSFTLHIKNRNYKSAEAVSVFEEEIFKFIESRKRIIGHCKKSDVEDFIMKFDERSGMALFSIARCVYVIIKTINEKSPKEEDSNYYFDILLNLTPIKLVNLLSILCVYMDWKNIEYIKSSGHVFINNKSVINYMNDFKNLHE